jgi:hypothetical protein
MADSPPTKLAPSLKQKVISCEVKRDILTLLGNKRGGFQNAPLLEMIRLHNWEMIEIF